MTREIPPYISERNWTEDFSHENGNYFNRCVSCKCMFRGHKRRVHCRLCVPYFELIEPLKT